MQPPFMCAFQQKSAMCRPRFCQKCTPVQKLSFSPRGLVMNIFTIEINRQLLFWLTFYKHLRIRSWWHLETNLRLQEEDIRHYCCVFGALASQASKSEPTRRDQDRPKKTQELCCLRYYNPQCAVQSIPSPYISEDPRPFFRSFPNISRRFPIYLPLC